MTAPGLVPHLQEACGLGLTATSCLRGEPAAIGASFTLRLLGGVVLGNTGGAGGCVENVVQRALKAGDGCGNGPQAGAGVYGVLRWGRTRREGGRYSARQGGETWLTRMMRGAMVAGVRLKFLSPARTPDRHVWSPCIRGFDGPLAIPVGRHGRNDVEVNGMRPRIKRKKGFSSWGAAEDGSERWSR